MAQTITGIREVLVFAENEGKVVTVRTANLEVTGKVLRVNPLVIEASEGGEVMVINFDAVESVGTKQATGQEVVTACKPQAETRFVGRSL